MKARKSFKVFGENIDVFITSAETNGSFCHFVQTCPPGGGPPPHIHGKEEELFRALEGEFELFDGTSWHKLPEGAYMHANRGTVHTFRNSGAKEGKLQCIAIPGGLDEYLEKISVLQMPEDGERLLEVSVPYGITYVNS